MALLKSSSILGSIIIALAGMLHHTQDKINASTNTSTISKIEDTKYFKIEDTKNYIVYQDNNKLKDFENENDAIQYATSWSNSRIMKDNHTIWDRNNTYKVYQYDSYLKDFNNIDSAKEYTNLWEHSSIRDLENKWLWNNYLDFKVYQNNNFLKDFNSYNDTLQYAKQYNNSTISFKNNTYIWNSNEVIQSEVHLDVPLVYQLPALPRGCEVTSLTMMLNFAGINVDKMTLATEVKRDPTPMVRKNGGVYFGNPYDGFVGDMYSFTTPGLAVYHGPIKELAEKYLPNKVIDLTDSNFDDILNFISKGSPVWIITNSSYNELSQDNFRTWHTPTGDIDITYKEHSVLITGYDEKYIYINDPLGATTKVNKYSFIKGWNQMGKQAVTYIN